MDPIENNMDEFLISNLTESDVNKTDSENYTLHPYHQFAVIMEVSSAICGIAGCIANMIIIWIIARNAKIQSRTNLLILHYSICDFVFLFSLTFVSYIVMAGVSLEKYHFSFCLLDYLDVSLHFNESIIMTVIITNTLFKNQKIKTPYIIAGLYGVILLTFVLHNVSCCVFKARGFLFLPCFLIFVINFFIMISKEINSCYKTHRVGDPLCKQTQFRLNLGRIYCYNYVASYSFALFIDFLFSNIYYMYLLVNSTYLTSVYILAYLIVNDRNYYECFFRMLKCQGGTLDEDGFDHFTEADEGSCTPPYDILSERLGQK